MRYKKFLLEFLSCILCIFIGFGLAIYLIGQKHLSVEFTDNVRHPAERPRNSTQKTTAIHEIGHALMFQKHFPEEDFVLNLGGFPEETGILGRLSSNANPYDDLSAKTIPFILSVYYGGRVAEEIIFGKNLVSTQSSTDMNNALSSATTITYNLLSNPISGKFFPPMSLESFTKTTGLYLPEGSEDALRKDIFTLLQQGYTDAKQHLEPQKTVIEKLADELLLKRRLTKKEFEEVLKKVRSSS